LKEKAEIKKINRFYENTLHWLQQTKAMFDAGDERSLAAADAMVKLAMTEIVQLQEEIELQGQLLSPHETIIVLTDPEVANLLAKTCEQTDSSKEVIIKAALSTLFMTTESLARGLRNRSGGSSLSGLLGEGN
jgi:hypothetical protein